MPSQCFLIMEYSIITCHKSFHFHTALSKFATECWTHLELWCSWHWSAKLAMLCPSAASWHRDVASLTRVPILLRAPGPNDPIMCPLLTTEEACCPPRQPFAASVRVPEHCSYHQWPDVSKVCSPDQFWSNVGGEHRDTLNPCFTVSEISLCPRIAMWFTAISQ